MKINGLATLMMTLLLLPAIGVPAAAENVVLPEIPRISVEELKKMVDDGGDFIVVDVRDAGSYTAGHIKGAINIYYDSTGDPMERQMMLMALPMDKLVVTYCDCTDDASSAMIADELYILGYERDKIKVLSGGSLRWVELGHPMVTSN